MLLPGFNNDFLCQTDHDLALTYNNNAPLENYHSANAFLIMKYYTRDFILNGIRRRRDSGNNYGYNDNDVNNDKCEYSEKKYNNNNDNSLRERWGGVDMLVDVLNPEGGGRYMHLFFCLCDYTHTYIYIYIYVFIIIIFFILQF
jgi:hypothetical protein